MLSRNTIYSKSVFNLRFSAVMLSIYVELWQIMLRLLTAPFPEIFNLSSIEQNNTTIFLSRNASVYFASTFFLPLQEQISCELSASRTFVINPQ
jgi:hypothetical protein